MKFYYNGIKSTPSAPMVKCHYYWNNTQNRFTVYARDYKRFPKEVHDAFAVENNTDIMTDYFENDRFDVTREHPLFPQVAAASAASIKKAIARQDKRRVLY